MRLDKYLAEMGKGTRSQLKQDLKRGLVTVNGQVEKSADRKVDPSVDKVTYAGEDVSYVAYEYYLLHKPAGYISATEDRRQEVDWLRTSHRHSRWHGSPSGAKKAAPSSPSSAFSSALLRS